MGFQTKVYTTVAPGVAGDLATPDQAIYQALNFIAEEPCTVGNFVFASATAPESQAVPGGSGQPLGLVQRNLSYVNQNITSPGTLTVPAGSALMVAILGDFWVVSATDATVGQAVFANATTGAVSTAAPGATVEGSVETSWRVKKGGAAGEPIIISNWSVAATNAAASGGAVDASRITGVLGTANGGTGLDTLGTAGQVLKVNSDADGLEWGNDATA